ncbi:hypothetical protein [Streptomyces sp. NBC_01198]|uniref:hypothetical protein n=1 Tax=Streptomyces sp. NBC_01198 TaxID=2903769 RepID=UPI002E10D0ED|nr:hypothetical protein OG702_03745 [Streptomyces sp. NBC_01198]
MATAGTALARLGTDHDAVLLRRYLEQALLLPRPSAEEPVDFAAAGGLCPRREHDGHRRPAGRGSAQ